MTVFYPDRRIMPRMCERTKLRRAECWCAPCRKLRQRKHRARCSCWLCLADQMGTTIDRLGSRSQAGRWLWFVTISFRTAHYPWARGFPIEEPKPSEDFANHFFAQMLRWIGREVHARVEYFFAHQFGSLNGRLHLHAGLSWPGLFEYRWKPLQEFIWRNAGFCRILPWEQAAGFYLSRYIGRAIPDCHWDFSLPLSIRLRSVPAVVGGHDVAVSPPLPSVEYRRTFHGRRKW